MKRNPVEAVLGAVVLAIAGMFAVFAYNSADLQAVEGYSVTAPFLKVGGLETGSDVRISGIKVGTVTAQSLDPETFEAMVTFTIGQDIPLPADSVAAIASDGLLGGTYLNLRPGSSDQTLSNGDTLNNTADYQSLEDLVGEIIFLATQDPGS